jgi:uncharacterized damage-inducible protein DinB
MPMTINQFRQLAAYNRWANSRLYAAALDLSDQAYRLHIGVFFGSLHGTLRGAFVPIGFSTRLKASA